MFRNQLRQIALISLAWRCASKRNNFGPLDIRPATPLPNCKLYPGWIRANVLLQKYSELYMSLGCNRTCTTVQQLPTVTIIPTYDSGFEDHVRRTQDWKEFNPCQEKGKEHSFAAVLNDTASATSTSPAVKRRVVFAAQGCLTNRQTWFRVWQEEVGRHVSIVSDCATGRMYRPGHDVSIPVLPYPRLLERECDHTKLIKLAYNSPPPDSAGTSTDIFFLGSPTSTVRDRLQSLEGGPPRGSGVRWNITVMHAATRKIHSMKASERPWTCGNLDCACLEAHALDHHERQRRSAFGLVPRGHGVYSFRLTEVLLAGAIPVVLSNGWVLPFSEVLDWDSFSVRLDEEAVLADPGGALAKLVTGVSPACVSAMRRRAHHVAMAFFSTTEGTVRGLAAVLASRALGCGGGRGQALGRDGTPFGNGPSPLCLSQPEPSAVLSSSSSSPSLPPSSPLSSFPPPRAARGASNSRGKPAVAAPSFDEWGGSVRAEVRLGTADMCLPTYMRSAALPTRVFMKETGNLKLRTKSPGNPPGVTKPFGAYSPSSPSIPSTKAKPRSPRSPR
mmetsp:Transcript_55785/g.104625  ORF Transcript_55785/g.104625 Transcript_55785/m.104625 type:complete len:559 (+) Transcript_55785:231-1907(+)